MQPCSRIYHFNVS